MAKENSEVIETARGELEDQARPLEIRGSPKMGKDELRRTVARAG